MSQKYIAAWAIAFIFIFNPLMLTAAENVPKEIAGIKLGSDLADYPDIVGMSFLKETVVTDRYGFRKGYISVGVCKHTDKILKMRLKYNDSSKKFFKKLLAEFKKKYGAPDEWKGDSFGILHIWKWHFTDEQGRRVTLQLQHNLRNTSENIGNQVKMSFPELIAEERDCFNDYCKEQDFIKDQEQLEKIAEPDWQYMIPR